MNSVPRISPLVRIFFLCLLILPAVAAEPVWASHDEDSPIPVTTVAIEGITYGEAARKYQFVAQTTPKDATEPILYNWTPEPESGQANSVATYEWDEPGIYTIKVSASGALDKTVSDLHTVEITTTMPVTVESVAISLASSAPLVVGESVTATLQLQPANADGYSVTWRPEPQQGQGKRQAVFSWPTAGLYAVKATATNVDGSTVSDLAVVVVKTADGSWGPTLFLSAVYAQ